MWKSLAHGYGYTVGMSTGNCLNLLVLNLRRKRSAGVGIMAIMCGITIKKLRLMKSGINTEVGKSAVSPNNMQSVRQENEDFYPI